MRAISKISFMTFYVGIHTWHRYVYSPWLVLFCTIVRFLIYFCRSVRTIVLAFPNFSKLSFPTFPVLENLQYSDPPIQIWNTYFYLDCYKQYFHVKGCTNLKVKLISYCPFPLYISKINFKLGVILQNEQTFNEKGLFFLYLLLNGPKSNNKFLRQTKIVIFDKQFFLSFQFYLTTSYLSWLYWPFLEIV